MPDGATFCSQCGGAITSAKAAPLPAERPAQRTMLGFASSPEAAPPATSAPAPAVAPDPPRAAATRPAGTMMGIAAVDLLPPQSRAPVPSPSSPQAVAGPGQPNPTMLGVAMPGIAPIHAGQGGPPSRSDNQTMLGVAVPGIAPVQAGWGAAPRSARSVEPPVIVPRPKTFFNEPVPEAFRKTKQKGIPLALVAGGVGALVVVLGIVVVVMWKSAPPLVVQPRLGEKNNEQLHLVCETCPDGTVASLGRSPTMPNDAAIPTATFKTKECNLDLATPLKVGDNPIEIHLDRPGMGRDEKVKAVVPIAYRVRADLSDISAEPPAISVRVETLPGTEVRIDGKPVALDASGKGTHAIDITAETEGSTEESRIIEKTVPYEVTLKGQKTERGTVSARVGVAALQIDAPGSHPVFDAPKFFVAGRTVKGSKVTVNGRPIDLTPAGTFGESFETTGVGDTILTIRATPPQLAARTVHLKVRRVEHLETEARAFEGVHLLGYDAISANIAASVGQSLVVEGEVLESRTLNHQTVAVVNDHRGCAHLPCPTRVTHGADDGLRPGDTVRAYGHVTRAVKNADGKSLPEVEADFLLIGKRRP
jgi:hypothetical protein